MMKTVKGFLAVLMIASLMTLVWSLAVAEDMDTVRVASLKGPTSMGLVKLMNDDASGESLRDYEFTVAGTADEIVPRIVKGEIDIALVPCNLASILYNNTGLIRVTAVSTLGVLYIVETGTEIQTIEDLRVKTIVSTGKGTTPEYGLRHVLSAAGIDPDKDVTIEYKSEAPEVAAALSAGTATVAMLPQPYVTAVMAQNANVRVALSLTDLWEAENETGSFVTGVVIARKAFLDENPAAVADFLKEYESSAAYVLENPAEASVWIEELSIAKAAIAEKALPNCNIVCITGEEMLDAVSGYLAALYAQEPASVGGQVPDDAFYAVEIEGAQAE